MRKVGGGLKGRVLNGVVAGMTGLAIVVGPVAVGEVAAAEVAAGTLHELRGAQERQENESGDDDQGYWGLLGLIGLVGLVGLVRRGRRGEYLAGPADAPPVPRYRNQ